MRAAIFIDGGYFLAQLKQYKLNIDYARLADYLLRPLRRDVPLDLLRTYFYYCPPYMSEKPTEDELRRMELHNQFMQQFENVPRCAMRLGKLQKRYDGQKEYYEQKRVDVLLSCDMVRHTAARDIQHAVLVAGDSDFIPTVTAAKDSGATVSLWCGAPNTVHKELVALADEVNHLDWRKIPQIGEKQPPVKTNENEQSSQGVKSTKKKRPRRRN